MGFQGIYIAIGLDTIREGTKRSIKMVDLIHRVYGIELKRTKTCLSMSCAHTHTLVEEIEELQK